MNANYRYRDTLLTFVTTTAYGDAASACLMHFHNLENNHDLRLGCLVAYYPTRIPDPDSRYPGGIQILVHLAGDDVGVVKRAQMVGIQGKEHTRQRQIDAGLGVGGRLPGIKYPAYSYNAEPGFAEHDLKEYDPVSAELAWTRSLTAANKAFQIDNDLESIVDTNIQGRSASDIEDLNITNPSASQILQKGHKEDPIHI